MDVLGSSIITASANKPSSSASACAFDKRRGASQCCGTRIKQRFLPTSSVA